MKTFFKFSLLPHIQLKEKFRENIFDPTLPLIERSIFWISGAYSGLEEHILDHPYGEGYVKGAGLVAGVLLLLVLVTKHLHTLQAARVKSTSYAY